MDAAEKRGSSVSGELYIVGAGPGGPAGMTREAVQAVEQADAVFFFGALDWWDREGTIKAEDGLWTEITPDRLPQAVIEPAAEKRVAFLVPGTPVGSPWAYLTAKAAQERRIPVRVVSGVPLWTAALEADGVFLVSQEGYVLKTGGKDVLALDCVPSGRASGPQDRVYRLQDGTTLVATAASSAWARVPWPLRRPLEGRRILLLREGAKSRQAAKRLEALGAVPLWAPISELIDPPSWMAVDRALDALSCYDWLIVTSGEAVDRFWRRLTARGLDIRRFRGQIAAVGQETAAALRRVGLLADLMPQTDFNQEGLAEALSTVPLSGRRVLMPGGQLNHPFLAETLRARGALVDVVEVYHNRPRALSPFVRQAIGAGRVDAVIFSASSAVEYLMGQLDEEGRQALSAVASFSIGPLTTKTLQRFGVSISGQAERPSLSALIDCVVEHFAQNEAQLKDKGEE